MALPEVVDRAQAARAAFDAFAATLDSADVRLEDAQARLLAAVVALERVMLSAKQWTTASDVATLPAVLPVMDLMAPNIAGANGTNGTGGGRAHIHYSKSLDGPWASAGELRVDYGSSPPPPNAGCAGRGERREGPQGRGDASR